MGEQATDKKSKIVNICLQVVNLIYGAILITISVLRFMKIGQTPYVRKPLFQLLYKLGRNGRDGFFTPISYSDCIHNVSRFVQNLTNVSAFGLFIIVFTLFFPDKVSVYFGFWRSWLGRGVFFISVACITLNSSILSLIFAIVVFGTGVAYCGLHFLPFVSAPIPLIPIGVHRPSTPEGTEQYSYFNN
jgi:hypothetical protein